MARASTELHEWRARAEGAEARALAAEQKLADYWKARALAAEARARPLTRHCRRNIQRSAGFTAEGDAPPQPTVQAASARVETEVPPALQPRSPARAATSPSVSEDLLGRHSSSLIIKRCIDQLAKIVDEMPRGRIDSVATAARLAQSLNTLKELQRRVALS